MVKSTEEERTNREPHQKPMRAVCEGRESGATCVRGVGYCCARYVLWRVDKSLVALYPCSQMSTAMSAASNQGYQPYQSEIVSREPQVCGVCGCWLARSVPLGMARSNFKLKLSFKNRTPTEQHFTGTAKNSSTAFFPMKNTAAFTMAVHPAELTEALKRPSRGRPGPG